MTRKQKHLLTRILVAAVLFLAGSLLHGGKRDDALTKTHVEEYSGDWMLQDEVRGIRLVVMRLVFH